jgi:hypothetical protein
MTWHDLTLGCIELSATLEFSSVLALSGYHDRLAFHYGISLILRELDTIKTSATQVSILVKHI